MSNIHCFSLWTDLFFLFGTDNILPNVIPLQMTALKCAAVKGSFGQCFSGIVIIIFIFNYVVLVKSFFAIDMR